MCLVTTIPEVTNYHYHLLDVESQSVVLIAKEDGVVEVSSVLTGGKIRQSVIEIFNKIRNTAFLRVAIKKEINQLFQPISYNVLDVKSLLSLTDSEKEILRQKGELGNLILKLIEQQDYLTVQQLIQTQFPVQSSQEGNEKILRAIRGAYHPDRFLGRDHLDLGHRIFLFITTIAIQMCHAL